MNLVISKTDLTFDKNLAEGLCKKLGNQIVKEGEIPTKIKTVDDEYTALDVVARFLLNYKFEMWENLVVLYLIYDQMEANELYFEDLEDAYHRFVTDVFAFQIYEHYLGY